MTGRKIVNRLVHVLGQKVTNNLEKKKNCSAPKYFSLGKKYKQKHGFFPEENKNKNDWVKTQY